MTNNHMIVLLSFFLVLLPVAATAPAPQAAASSFGSRAEKEAFLLKATIPSEPAGAKLFWRTTLDDGRQKHDASVERVTASDPSQRDYRFNIAAYELDKVLELNFVPPSVERTVNGRRVAVTWWMDSVLMNELARRKQKIEPPDVESWNKQFQAVRLFDELVSNAYRRMGPDDYTSTVWDNLLITKDWTIWLIDHTRTFRTNMQLDHPESLTRCDRRLLGKLRGLNKDVFGRTLGQYLSSEQLDALEVRRQLLVKYFDQEIARRGEEAVLYDLPRRP